VELGATSVTTKQVIAIDKNYIYSTRNCWELLKLVQQRYHTSYVQMGIEFQLTHTAAAAGFSVLDALIDAWYMLQEMVYLK